MVIYAELLAGVYGSAETAAQAVEQVITEDLDNQAKAQNGQRNHTDDS